MESDHFNLCLEAAERLAINVNPTVHELKTWLRSVRTVGFDIETDGLNHHCTINSVQVADQDRAFVITEDIPRALSIIWMYGAGRVAVHNLGFDIREVLFLMRDKLCDTDYESFARRVFERVEDTMTMSHVLFGATRRKFGLSDMVAVLVPQYAWGEDQMLRHYQEVTGVNRKPSLTAMGNFKASITPEEWATNPRCIDYAACDAAAACELWHILKEMAAGTPVEKVFRTERKYIPSVVQLNSAYMPVNPYLASELIDRLTRKLAKAQAKADDQFGVDVGHPTRLQELAVEWVGDDEDRAEVLGKTPTGRWKLDADSLAAAEEAGWKVAKHANKIKALDKRVQLFDGISEVGEANRDRFGLNVPYTYRSCGASATGRGSVSNPPLHQVPRDKEFREMFEAIFGWRMVVADFSTMEPRVAAILSRDEALREALLTGDMYTVTAQQIDGPGDVKPERRQQFKNFFMAYLFGAGAPRLSKQADMSVEEAKRIKDALDSMFPVFSKWCYQMGGHNPPLTHTPFGYPLEVRKGYEYQRVSHAVQSYAAYVMKKATIRLRKRYPKVHSRLVCSVHDELILHVPKDEAKPAAKALEACMTTDDWVPLPAVAHIGQSWGEAK